MTHSRPHTEAELVEFVRSIDVPAPESLHRRVELLIARRGAERVSAPRRAIALVYGALGSAPRLALAGAGTAAALAIALALSLGGGGASGPSLHEAAAVTQLPATAPAPRESHTRHAELLVSVDSVSFPYWQERLGWRATGSRTDRVGARQVTTVFYANRDGRHVGYAIVAGLPAPHVSGGQTAWRHGTAYTLVRENGTPVLTWQRGGHMCVLSGGSGVDAATLLHLASWHGSVSA
jgi:hypothetical protein